MDAIFLIKNVHRAKINNFYLYLNMYFLSRIKFDAYRRKNMMGDVVCHPKHYEELSSSNHLLIFTFTVSYR